MGAFNKNEVDFALEITGNKISANIFLKRVEAFYNLVRVVADDVVLGSRWIIKVREGSANVGLCHEPETLVKSNLKLIQTKISNGICGLEKGKEIKKWLPEKAIKHAYDLAHEERGQQKANVVLWIGGKANHITHKITENATPLLNVFSYEDYGTIEGRLKIVSIHDGFSVTIYDFLRDKAVKCLVREDLLPDVLKAFGNRVEVIGKIQYKKDGTPIVVNVNKIKEFPESKEIADFRSVRGILRASNA